MQMAGKSMDDTGGAWYNVDPQKISHYQLKDAKDVVKKLYEMYYSEEPRSILEFASVLEGLVELEGNMDNI